MDTGRNNIHKIEEAQLSFEELVKAYFDCRKNKRNTHQSKEFEFELEKNLIELYDELENESYEIGQSICFVVTVPKAREVWAGRFRDRIVHHLIFNLVKDRFHRRFINETFSCIPERGTLAGARTAESYARKVTCNYTKKAYFLKADIANFFNSIDKNILYAEIQKYVKEPWLIKLIHKVIYNDPKKMVFIKSPKELFDMLPKHKSLFNTPEEKGLPIGNLTSQFFSNVYLNPIDQFIKHKLKCKYYCRYVDDMLLLHEDPGYLNYAYSEINKYLMNNLSMELSHRKKVMNLACRGFDFVGHVIKPNRIYLRTTTIKNSFRTIENWKRKKDWYSPEEIKAFRSKINSYLGMYKHVNGYRLRKKLCEKSMTLFTLPDDNYSKILTPEGYFGTQP